MFTFILVVEGLISGLYLNHLTNSPYATIAVLVGFVLGLAIDKLIKRK
jgi:hypothetical protein